MMTGATRAKLRSLMLAFAERQANEQQQSNCAKSPPDEVMSGKTSASEIVSNAV